MPKNVKGGLWEFLYIHFILLQNRKKIMGPFGDIKKICQKSLTKPKKPAQKIFVKGGTRTHVLLLGRPQKNLITLYAKCQ